MTEFRPGDIVEDVEARGLKGRIIGPTYPPITGAISLEWIERPEGTHYALGRFDFSVDRIKHATLDRPAWHPVKRKLSL